MRLKTALPIISLGFLSSTLGVLFLSSGVESNAAELNTGVGLRHETQSTQVLSSLSPPYFPSALQMAVHPLPIGETPQRLAQVPYVSTPEDVVMEMLQLAEVGREDVVYDLGSGDGRVVITAAQKFGARGVGVEINPELVEESRKNAEVAGVGDRTQFIRQDLFKTDLSNATVVTLYLLPSINRMLRPKLLKELKPGTRIVSHNYNLGREWKPDRVVRLKRPPRDHTIYLWVVPGGRGELRVES